MAAFVAGAEGAYAQPTALGAVDAASGIASMLRGGTPRMATSGASLLPGDRVVTGPGARLSLAMADGSTLFLAAGTTVHLAGSGVFDLLAGTVRTVLPSSGIAGRVDIRSPAASASATAAEWIVEATETDTAVHALSGTVDVSATKAKRRVTLEAGVGTMVSAGAPPRAPERWDPQRLARLLDATAPP